MTRRSARSRRRAPTRRTSARRSAQLRRRRAGILLVVAALVGLGIVLAAPLFQKAVDEIALPLRHEDIIRQQAADKDLDPALIAAVIYAETRFVPRTSPAGAEGLMQILPSTARDIARRSGGVDFVESDLGTPQVNISYGSYYLRYLLDRYQGKEILAVAAYNAGETNVNRWLAEREADSLVVGDIPFPETRAYVQKVLETREQYRANYATELGIE